MDEVQRAIEWMEIEKESAQNDWERAGAEWRMEPGTQEMHDEQMAAFDLAIQALRQYQKPTDEAVQDAISWLESDKIGRQREWEKHDTEWKLEPGAKEMHDSFMSAFDLAITALRQMRTEPCRCTEICGICNNPKYHIHSSIWWKSASTEYGRENREIPTRHCPNCGKLVKHDG